MTKAEQARRMAWRFKVLQQACEETRNVARSSSAHWTANAFIADVVVQTIKAAINERDQPSPAGSAHWSVARSSNGSRSKRCTRRSTLDR